MVQISVLSNKLMAGLGKHRAWVIASHAAGPQSGRGSGGRWVFRQCSFVHTAHTAVHAVLPIAARDLRRWGALMKT